MMLSALLILAGIICLCLIHLSRGLSRRLREAETQQRALIEEKSVAITQRDEIQTRYTQMERERNQMREEKETVLRRVHEMERQVSLSEQRLSQQEQRIRDWEAQREEMTKAAHHSVMEAGSKMSSKLLEDHKRETEAAKKESEKRIRQETEKFGEQFVRVTSMLSQMDHKHERTNEHVETLMRTLSHPGGAGQLAEAGLENTLKNLGLKPGRDFVMQYHVRTGEGRVLRPDAVVFLPQNMVVVVDSKASKFFLELAEAEGSEHESAVLEKLSKSMNEHLRALSGKQYKEAVADYMRQGEREGTIGHMLNVMYLPGEASIEKLKIADPQFQEKLEKHQLILTGPTGLHSIFSIATMAIAEARQAENEKHIIATVSELMENVISAFNHVGKTGASLTRAMEHFNSFSRSVNARLLPRMHKLRTLGVEPAKNKSIPGRLPTYEVHRSDETLELTAEEKEMEVENVALRELEETA